MLGVGSGASGLRVVGVGGRRGNRGVSASSSPGVRPSRSAMTPLRRPTARPKRRPITPIARPILSPVWGPHSFGRLTLVLRTDVHALILVEEAVLVW